MRRDIVLLVTGMMLCVGLSGGIPRAHADDPVARAVSWLHTQQLADGSFGSATSGSASITADVVYVLARAGEDPGSTAWTVNGHSALDALSALTPAYIASGDAGQAGKIARAVAAAGRNPRDFAGRDIIRVIEQAYAPATGRYHPTLLFRHTVAVEALLRAGEPVPSAAISALFNAQLPNGGWFWAFVEPSQIDPTQDQSDVDATGRVLQLLADRVGTTCGPVFGQAKTYLARGQLAGGGWGVRASQGPENANSTALVIAGLRAIGQDPDAAPFRSDSYTATTALLNHQESSGAFVYIRQAGREESRVMATVDALIALLQLPGAAPECQSLYLPLIWR